MPISMDIPMNYPETVEITGKLAKEVVRTGKTSERVDIPIKHASGERRIVSALMSQIKDAQGNITGTISIMRDVTEERKRE
jgi:PAS domain S-box-containing protein